MYVIIYLCKLIIIFGGEDVSKRFIIEKEYVQIEKEHIKIFEKDIHHINVLRYKCGDEIYINDYRIRIDQISSTEIQGEIIGKLEKRGEPIVEITLIQSYLKSDKMDYAIQKAVELGVKNIIPVITKNTVIKLDSKDRTRKKERLTKIVKEAIQQCGRTDLVSVESIQELNDIGFEEYDLVLICSETSKTALSQVLKVYKEKKSQRIAVLIGPEGGFENMEIANIKAKNKEVVSLGQRILRAETATINILSILSYEFNL